MTTISQQANSRFLERVEGEAAKLSIDERLVALTDPQGAAAEQYRMLLHRLRFQRSQRPATTSGSVVALTSSVRGEGVSVTAANLALTAARTGDARVALVDCDLRRGAAASLFGIGARMGLSDLLAGRCEVGEAMGLSTEGKLAVIGAGKPPSEAAALLAGPRFGEMLAMLRNLFDEIYLDVPPTLATADAGIVAHKADGVVLVVRADGTPREQVDAAVRTLAGAPIWGVVLNGVDPARVPAPLPVVKGRLGAGR